MNIHPAPCIYVIKEPIPACIASLQIQTDLLSTPLQVELQDRHGNRYLISSTTGPLGLLTIEVSGEDSVLPQFLLNEFAGGFKMRIYRNQKPTFFRIDGLWTNTVLFKVKRLYPSAENYTLSQTFEFTTVVPDTLLGLDYYALDETFILV